MLAPNPTGQEPLRAFVHGGNQPLPCEDDGLVSSSSGH